MAGDNNQPLDVQWFTDENWRLTVPLAPCENQLTLDAYDFQDNLIASDTITVSATNVLGDFDGDAWIGAGDIDLLYEEVRAGTHSAARDLNGDGLVDQRDVQELVLNIVGTRFGDTDLDGDVDQSDFDTSPLTLVHVRDPGLRGVVPVTTESVLSTSLSYPAALVLVCSWTTCSDDLAINESPTVAHPRSSFVKKRLRSCPMSGIISNGTQR